MTNPISKAVAKVAVNMGYGKASDYKGFTIKEVLTTMFIKMGYGKRSDYSGDLTDVLYGAAKIAKEKGGPGGSSVLDDLIEGKSGIHLVSNAESVVDAAFVCMPQDTVNVGLGWYLESVSLPNATSIGNAAFARCSSLTSVNFPNATSIGNSAFASCSSLTSVNLPKVTSILPAAFDSCSSLTSVDLPNATSIGLGAFYGISSTTVINIGAAEGEIEGAPWGAPGGVTINYNVK